MLPTLIYSPTKKCEVKEIKVLYVFPNIIIISSSSKDLFDLISPSVPICYRSCQIKCLHRADECTFFIGCVTANRLKSQNGTLFSHVWRQGRLALDPLQNKSCSEFFSQAYKNWHITWGNNLGPDWPPLARGSKVHTITNPPGRFLPSPRQWKIMSL